MVAISVTLNTALLDEIDERAKKMDLNRSQYFRRLAREDLTRPLQQPANPPAPAAAAEVAP